MKLLRLAAAVLLIGGAVYLNDRGGEAPVAVLTRIPALAPATVPVAAPGVVAPKVATVFEKSPDLDFYQRIHGKVFLSDREQRDRQDILRDQKLLRGLSARLRHASFDISAIKEQDAALDLLFEAFKSGDSDAARTALQDIVSDRQIEDAAINLDSRKQLAGIKGEVLFRLSATDPAGVTALTTLLPGPVSRKIWANVQRVQKSNVELSLAEVRANDE